MARAAALLLAIAASTPLAAFDLNQQVSVNGVASLGLQCQRLRGGGPDQDLCRFALPFQPALSFRPNEAHQVFVKLGLGVGNGLSDVTSFTIDPWAADLEDSLRDINGGSRDYVLTAWYSYTAKLEREKAVRITAGIIDSTDYIDTNTYSNDEYTQFMNSALVNGPNAFAPSYAPGLALQWRAARLSLTGVFMHVDRENEDSFDFYGVQVGYHLDTPLGRGNYRLLLDTSSQDFDEPTGTSQARRAAVLFSSDQQVGESLGVFVRLGWQSDKPGIDYRDLYSGGVDIGGAKWGRPVDNIGVAYAYLAGGNLGIEKTEVAEAYYRLALVPALAITADIQYMSEERDEGDGPTGLVLGLRVTTQF